MRGISVKAVNTETDPPHVFTVTGQEAKCLLALKDAGSKGCTAQEAAGWAYRLSAYCHSLRHKHNLDIKTHRADHPGGWHGRHELLSPVEIIEIKRKEGADG